jgi:hypothetical protein
MFVGLLTTHLIAFAAGWVLHSRYGARLKAVMDEIL